MISKEEVSRIAKLARLDLADSEIEKMQHDMSAVLDYFEVLKKAKHAKVVREVVIDNSVRKDIAREGNVRQAGDLLSQAPSREGEQIKVKQILQ